MYRFIANSSSAASSLLRTGSPKKSLLALSQRLTSTTAPATGNASGTTKGEQKAFSTAAAEPFLNGSSGAYVEEMYNAWLQNPASVHAVSHF